MGGRKKGGSRVGQKTVAMIGVELRGTKVPPPAKQKPEGTRRGAKCKLGEELGEVIAWT